VTNRAWITGSRKLQFVRRISTDKRPCVQQTITVYRLARNGLLGSVQRPRSVVVQGMEMIFSP
jgi:hypothetical protein